MTTTIVPNSLPLQTIRSGKPRLDKYAKLMARFYEALFIVSSLGQVRDVHKGYPPLKIPKQAQYLRDLAFICDFETGGKSFTSIGVVETDQSYIFYLASRCGDKCASLLSESLAQLHSYAVSVEREFNDIDAKRSIFIKSCVQNAERKVSRYIRFLNLSVQEALADSDGKADTAEDRDFIRWLESIYSSLNEKKDIFTVCQDMVDASNSMFMARLTLEQHRETSQQQSTALKISTKMKGPFTQTRHYIARLGCRIRKPIHLLDHVELISSILSSYEVKLVNSLESPPLPSPDGLTNLESILSRLFGRERLDEMNQVKQMLIQFNTLTNGDLFRDYMNNYNKCNPVVHSEICLLEFFARQKQPIRFLNGDRYFYSSKPACFNCARYFAHHPMHMLPPESHEKIYINWGPPLIQRDGRSDDAFFAQRKLIIHIIENLRTAIVDQSYGKSFSRGWHADSTTGLRTFTSNAGEARYRRDTDSVTIAEDDFDGQSVANGLEDDDIYRFVKKGPIDAGDTVVNPPLEAEVDDGKTVINELDEEEEDIYGYTKGNGIGNGDNTDNGGLGEGDVDSDDDDDEGDGGVVI